MVSQGVGHGQSELRVLTTIRIPDFLHCSTFIGVTSPKIVSSRNDLARTWYAFSHLNLCSSGIIVNRNSFIIFFFTFFFTNSINCGLVSFPTLKPGASSSISSFVPPFPWNFINIAFTSKSISFSFSTICFRVRVVLLFFFLFLKFLLHQDNVCYKSCHPFVFMLPPLQGNYHYCVLELLCLRSTGGIVWGLEGWFLRRT